MLFYLKVSRPGLWFTTIWLYILPTAQNFALFQQLNFWVGFLYVCFPLNLMIYGINDIADYEIDRLNIRKDSFLFGAKGSRAQLATLPAIIAGTQLPFWLYFIFYTQTNALLMTALLVTMVLLNIIYNLPKIGLRTNPPWEMLNQLGYLLLVPFSILINDAPGIVWPAVVYLILFCSHSHLMGEIMDYYPDRLAGRRTTTTVVGMVNAKLIVSALVIFEITILLSVFQDFFLAVILMVGVLWLLLDAMLLFRDKQYSKWQFTLFGLGANGLGVASMLWVWSTGSLQNTKPLFTWY